MTTTCTFTEALDKHVEQSKPIEFLRWFNPANASFVILDRNRIRTPKEFLNVVLLNKATDGQELDVMLAYNQNPLDNCLYLGYWNDGTV
jgi:hypothetical protein